MKGPVVIRKVPEKYRVEVKGDEITVWNGSNGRGYPLKKLAPFTDDEDGEDDDE